MLKYIVLFFLVFLSQNSFAQKDTIPKRDYFVLPIQITEINSKRSVLIGIEGGTIYKSGFVFGAGGWGQINNTGHRTGYTGLIFGWSPYIKPVQIFPQVLVGGGFTVTGLDNLGNAQDATGYFILVPSLTGGVFVNEWISIEGGGGYRWIKGSDLYQGEDEDLSGSFWQLGFRFTFKKKQRGESR